MADGKPVFRFWLIDASVHVVSGGEGDVTSQKQFARPTTLLRPDGQKEGEQSLVSKLEGARGVDEVL